MSAATSPTTMPAEEAAVQGFKALTIPILPCEAWILDRVLEDMRRGNVEFVLVPSLDRRGHAGTEVWRKGLVT
jgi:hypothetical protein